MVETPNNPEDRFNSDDRLELTRFRKYIHRGNAPGAEEPVWRREFNHWCVIVTESTGIPIQEFNFKEKDAADLAYKHAQSFE